MRQLRYLRRAERLWNIVSWYRSCRRYDYVSNRWSRRWLRLRRDGLQSLLDFVSLSSIFKPTAKDSADSIQRRKAKFRSAETVASRQDHRMDPELCTAALSVGESGQRSVEGEPGRERILSFREGRLEA